MSARNIERLGIQQVCGAATDHLGFVMPVVSRRRDDFVVDMSTEEHAATAKAALEMEGVHVVYEAAGDDGLNTLRITGWSTEGLQRRQGRAVAASQRLQAVIRAHANDAIDAWMGMCREGASEAGARFVVESRVFERAPDVVNGPAGPGNFRTAEGNVDRLLAAVAREEAVGRALRQGYVETVVRGIDLLLSHRDGPHRLAEPAARALAIAGVTEVTGAIRRAVEDAPVHDLMVGTESEMRDMSSHAVPLWVSPQIRTLTPEV